MVTPASDMAVNLDVDKLNKMAEEIKHSQDALANFELVDNHA